MSAVPPPLASPERVAAERALARAAGVARVSAWVMLVLGAASVLASVRTPISAGFAISVAVVINGWFERRWARRLAERMPSAPSRLAINQVALGCEVLAYAVWQAYAVGPEQIDAVLRRPVIARFLVALDPAAVHQLVGMLPSGVRFVYLLVGAGTFLGCAATGAYYLSRSRALRLLAGPPPAPPHSGPPALH